MTTLRSFSIFISVALVVVIALTLREAVSTTLVVHSNPVNSQVQEMARIKRVQSAESARLNGLVQDYMAKQAQEAEHMLKVRDTEALRLSGLSQDYFARQAGEIEQLQRVRDTESARLNGLAQYHLAMQAQKAQNDR